MVSVEYEIDAEGRVRAVGGDWEEAARAVGAAELMGDSVLGRPVLDFIADAETRHLYAVLFDAVRSAHRPAAVPFRCDTPDRRRFMELRIVPADSQALCLSSVLVREEEREPVALYPTSVDRDADFVCLCSWCQRVRVEGESWVEVEVAIRQLALFSRSSPPSITHGACGECTDRVLREIKERA